jgi:hypothetical protein
VAAVARRWNPSIIGRLPLWGGALNELSHPEAPGLRRVAPGSAEIGAFTVTLTRLAMGRIRPVGWLMIALLVGAVAAVVAAEWPRLSARYGDEARTRRDRARRKSQLKLIRSETEEFEASVVRDLDQLPTIEETDRKR